jgi:hypothetical protein
MKKKGAAAVFAVLGVGLLAAATAQPASASAQVAIEPVAQYDVYGFMIHVELKARCDGGPRLQLVQVDLTQSHPETPWPIPGGAMGSGFADVVCDGRTHEVGVTITGDGFDAGSAFAAATLFAGDGSSDTDARQIDIRVG